MLRPFGLLSLASLAACGAAEVPALRGPNVLLVSIDTLRPDHLSCYGYARETSPGIDALARAGVLFESHVSSTSWTLPAHAAMFTGLSDSVHGCTDVAASALAPQLTTLAERFAGAGYRTAGFYSGPYLDAAFGLDQGFERWVDCTSVGALGPDVAAWASDRDVMHRAHTGVTSERVVAEARAFVTQSTVGAPFFAFVHLWDVHFDFTPPAPFDTLFDPDYTGEFTGEDFFFDARIDSDLAPRDLAHLEALYDGEIRWTDENLGQLLAALDAAGLTGETLVAVTSDHGTEFFEHGFKAHRTTLFDEQIRIPLVLRFPGRLEPGRRVAHQTRMIDLAPTLLELAGLAGLPNAMGRSLVPLARGEAPTWDTTAVSELFSLGRALRGARTLETKLLVDEGQGLAVAYDLLRDPGELEPRSPAPLEVEQLRRVERALDVARALTPGAAPAAAALPAEVQGQLEALGYTDDD